VSLDSPPIKPDPQSSRGGFLLPLPTGLSRRFPDPTLDRDPLGYSGSIRQAAARQKPSRCGSASTVPSCNISGPPWEPVDAPRHIDQTHAWMSGAMEQQAFRPRAGATRQQRPSPRRKPGAQSKPRSATRSRDTPLAIDQNQSRQCGAAGRPTSSARSEMGAHGFGPRAGLVGLHRHASRSREALPAQLSQIRLWVDRHRRSPLFARPARQLLGGGGRPEEAPKAAVVLNPLPVSRSSPIAGQRPRQVVSWRLRHKSQRSHGPGRASQLPPQRSR